MTRHELSAQRGLSALHHLRTRLDAGRQSVRALALETLRRLDGKEGVTPICEADVLAMAEYAAGRISQESVRDLTGIPIAVGHEICVKGVNASYDATIARKLKGYGAVLCALAESPCRVVARGLFRVAFGSDLLRDAKANRVYALRPSFGTVSRYGILGAPSLIQVGVAAKSPAECAVGMDAVSDFDPFDPAMRRPNCYHYAERFGLPLRALRIGATPDARVEGVRVSQTISLTALSWAEDLHELVLRAEKGLLGKNPMLTPAEYAHVRSARGRLSREMENALGLLDALLLPATPAAIAAVELCGLPAVATPDGLLIVSKHFQETVALQIADALEWEESR